MRYVADVLAAACWVLAAIVVIRLVLRMRTMHSDVLEQGRPQSQRSVKEFGGYIIEDEQGSAFVKGAITVGAKVSEEVLGRLVATVGMLAETYTKGLLAASLMGDREALTDLVSKSFMPILLGKLTASYPSLSENDLRLSLTVVNREDRRAGLMLQEHLQTLKPDNTAVISIVENALDSADRNDFNPILDCLVRLICAETDRDRKRQLQSAAYYAEIMQSDIEAARRILIERMGWLSEQVQEGEGDTVRNRRELADLESIATAYSTEGALYGYVAYLGIWGVAADGEGGGTNMLRLASRLSLQADLRAA